MANDGSRVIKLSVLVNNIVDEGHPEDWCEDCGESNVVWSAPNVLWNAVVALDREPGHYEDPMLCPTCFAKRAVGAGHAKRGWVLVPWFSGWREFMRQAGANV